MIILLILLTIDHKDSTDHIIKLFSKLILEDNVLAAVHLVTEQAGGGVLHPDAMVLTGQNPSISVRDALLLKHPELLVPPVSTLPSVILFLSLRMLRLVVLMFRL